MVPSIIVKLCVQILHQDIITESPEVNDPGLLFQGNKWRENRGNRVSITIFKLWRKQGSTEENLEQLQGIKYFVMLVVKNWPANLGNKRDVGLIPGSRRSPAEGMVTHSSILAWRIPWTEEPGGLQPIGSQRVGHD